MALTPDRKDVSNPSIEVVHDRNADWPDGRPPEWPFDRRDDRREHNAAATATSARDRARLLDGETLVADDWTPPFHVRHRLWTIGAAVISIVWILGAYFYIAADLGFDVLASLLPHEVGGLAAGVFTPIALVWIVAAVYERARIYQAEAQALRWHLSRFT
jgi:hypothetical protein